MDGSAVRASWEGAVCLPQLEPGGRTWKGRGDVARPPWLSLLPPPELFRTVEAGEARAHRRSEELGDRARQDHPLSLNWLGSSKSFGGSQMTGNRQLIILVHVLSCAETSKMLNQRRSVRAFSPRTIGILPFSKPKP